MRRRLRRGDDGVTTVEFALVFPLFFLLIGIGFYFAWIFYVQSQVDAAADRAARYAAVPYSTSKLVQRTVDVNGNITVPGNLPVNTPALPTQTYTVTESTTTYHYCVTEIVNEVNSRLAANSITAADVELSDGTGTVLSSSTPCAKPLGYVKVKVSRNFTNPFSYLTAPFLGTTTDMTITGTGRARVESE